MQFSGPRFRSARTCTHLLSGREGDGSRGRTLSHLLLTSQTRELRIIGKHCGEHETLVTCVIAMRCQTYSLASERPKMIMLFTETPRLKENDSSPCKR